MLWAVVLLVADSPVERTLVRDMTPKLVQEAVAEGQHLPQPDASDATFFSRWTALEAAGKTGFYYLDRHSDEPPQGVALFTTPYSRVVAASYSAAELGQEFQQPPADLLRPELHVYVTPGESLTSEGRVLLTAFLRPVGSTDVNANEYPVKVESVPADGYSTITRDLVEPVYRLTYPLDALAAGKELITVWRGWPLSCKGQVCAQRLDVVGVR